MSTLSIIAKKKALHILGQKLRRNKDVDMREGEMATKKAYADLVSHAAENMSPLRRNMSGDVIEWAPVVRRKKK